MRKPRYLGVLLGNAVARIYHDDAHVRSLYRHLRAHDRELLYPLLHLGLSSDSGGVDEHIAANLVFKHGVHRVARRARHVADNEPLFTENTVDKRGLANVGLADNGDLDAVLLLVLVVLIGKFTQAGVKQIAGAVAVNRRYGDRVAKSQGVKLIHSGVGGAGGVRLVDGKHNRLLRALKHTGDLVIRRRNAGAQVRDQHDDRRGVNGYLRLFTHEQENFAVRGRLNSAGVHNIKFASAPLALGIEPVARDAGGVLNNAQSLPDKAVEKHGLADVRASYYCNKRS